MCVYYDVSNSFFMFMFLHRSKKLRNLLLLPFFKWNCSKESHNYTTYVNVWLYKNWDSHFHLANCTRQELWIFYMFSVDMRFMPVWKCESIFFQITKFGLSSSLYLLFPHDGMELNNFTLKMKKYAKSYLGQNFWKARSSLSSIQ